ncbi:GNAT family N-acetyltransferase [Pseudohoeflea coraliihabitans]|uniref:N-acetyltransferase n=1 Tax=Pseudohoeflea coraliihabitans TaxID=2860393 RepID=A0ABS6WLQ3_9HYPH|nr:N-acetyltransferase [Pseudohoeflea sp. DP4N28-3]MBW3096710.1 N-acetyltransferase [Pseudohoeflea sp. DP4N28-3]
MPHGRIAVSQCRFRAAEANDRAAISAVEEAAFGRSAEAELSHALNASPDIATLSLVAERAGDIIGHVLFSAIEGPGGALALAPLAVAPAWQDMHVGTELVRRGLDAAAQAGWRAVYVLGAPGYYCRFGFRSELADAATVPWQGPEFMAIELTEDALRGWTGTLRYPAPFTALG